MRKAILNSTIGLAVAVGAAIGAITVQSLHAQTKPPVYVVTETTISDLDKYLKEYVPASRASIKASGGRQIAAGQNFVALEGPSPETRVAISQFDSLEAVQAWRASTAFKEARMIGDKYATYRTFAIEGLPQ